MELNEKTTLKVSMYLFPGIPVFRLFPEFWNDKKELLFSRLRLLYSTSAEKSGYEK